MYGIEAILASIDKRVKVTSTLTEDEFIKINSNLGQLKKKFDDSILETKSHFKPILYIVKKFFNKFDYHGGIEIDIESEIPTGVGLGSSSACYVASTSSISGLFEKLSKEEILKTSIEAERTIFQDASGADSTISTFGGIIKYSKKNGFTKITAKPNFELVIGNSNKIHSTNKIVAKVKKFRDENPKKFETLCKLETLLIRRVSDSLENNDHNSLGKAMTENQDYLEQIGVSNEKLRSMIKVAEENCYGAKLTGAGDGGCIIALTDESNTNKTLKGMKAKNFECFKVKIDFDGLHNF